MEATQSAGATPVASDAMSGQSETSQAANSKPAASEPATGDAAALSDGGRRAIEAERAARRDAEKQAKAARDELDSLRTAQLSDHEKAIAQARKEATTEATQKAHALVRRAEVRRALASAGVVSDSLDLAAGAPDFAGLTVDDNGQVSDLEKSVAQFRQAHPSLFTAPRAAAGNFDGGPGGARPDVFTRDLIANMSQADFEKRQPEILRAMREGRFQE